MKVEGMTTKSSKSFYITLQVNAEKKGIEFIFGNNKSLKVRPNDGEKSKVKPLS